MITEIWLVLRFAVQLVEPRVKRHPKATPVSAPAQDTRSTHRSRNSCSSRQLLGVRWELNWVVQAWQ